MKTLKAVMKRVVVLVTLVFMAAEAEAQSIYHVRDTATGANNGADWANAYRDLPTTLKRGATYYIAAGTYSSHVLQDAESGTDRITIRKATAGDHGAAAGWLSSYGEGTAVFQGALWFEKGYYTLDGASRQSLQSGYGIKVSNYPYTIDTIIAIGDYNRTPVRGITLRYVEVEGSHSRGTNFDRGVQVLWNSDNFTAQYCSVHDVGNCPFYLRGSQNSLIEYCFVARNTYTAAVHSEGISASDGVNNFTVRYNWWEDLEGTAGIAAPSVGHTAFSNWYIYGNVFYFTPTYWTVRKGIGFGNGIISLFDCTISGDFVVYNNTVANVSAAGFGWSFGLPTSAARLYVKDNLWYNCSRVDPMVPSGIGDLQWAHNAYIDTPTGDNDAGKSIGTGDPFINWTNGNFRLKGPILGGVALLPPFNLDPDGKVRGADGTWDFGAWEYKASANPVAAVEPLAHDFGSVAVGSTNYLTFVVRNVGGGNLAGVASVSVPFQVVGGGAYSLGKDQSQVVTVRYAPVLPANDQGTAFFTGGGGVAVPVTGFAR